MDNFASIENSGGILKKNYGSDRVKKDATEEALTRRRNKLFTTKMGRPPETISDQLPKGAGYGN